MILADKEFTLVQIFGGKYKTRCIFPQLPAISALNGLSPSAVTVIYEPRCEKTAPRDFRPGPTQTGRYSHRRWLEA